MAVSRRVKDGAADTAHVPVLTQGGRYRTGKGLGRATGASSGTTSLVAAGSVLSAGAASAHSVQHCVRKPVCTITATNRATGLDQLRPLENCLRGHKVTRDERKAFEPAARGLVIAARDAKMPAADRTADFARQWRVQRRSAPVVTAGPAIWETNSGGEPSGNSRVRTNTGQR